MKFFFCYKSTLLVQYSTSMDHACDDVDFWRKRKYKNRMGGGGWSGHTKEKGGRRKKKETLRTVPNLAPTKRKGRGKRLGGARAKFGEGEGEEGSTNKKKSHNETVIIGR